MHDGDGVSPPEDRVGRYLYSVSRYWALAGSLILLAGATTTLVSIIGRRFQSVDAIGPVALPAWIGPIRGDFELVAMATAVMVVSSLPYCHMTRGDAAVDLIPVRSGARLRAIADIASNCLFAALAILFLWRMAVQVQILVAYGDTTMVLRLPVWWPYGPAIMSMLLLAACCVYRVVTGIGALRRITG